MRVSRCLGHLLQVLMEAKQKLGSTVRQKLADAIAARKHEDVMRFTRLFRPLRLQVCIFLRSAALIHALGQPPGFVAFRQADGSVSCSRTGRGPAAVSTVPVQAGGREGSGTLQHPCRGW